MSKKRRKKAGSYRSYDDTAEKLRTALSYIEILEEIARDEMSIVEALTDPNPQIRKAGQWMKGLEDKYRKKYKDDLLSPVHIPE